MAHEHALFRRSLAAILVLMTIAVAVAMLTDEATSTAGARLGRLAAITPLVVAVALLGVSGHARLRGELRALEALGMKPWQAVRGAERAGFVVAVMSLVVLVAPWTDVRSLFPAVHPAVDWRFTADGMTAFAPGVAVHADGAIDLMQAVPPTMVARTARDALPLATPIALLVSAWAATPMAALRRAASGGATCALAIAGLHAIAAERLAPSFGAVAALPLALSLWLGRRT